MRKGSKLAIGGIFLVLLCCGTLLLLTGRDRLNSPERRAWKDAALSAIRDETDRRAGELRTPKREFLRDDSSIIFEDGSWIIFRQVCYKEKSQIEDLFIGRASDGKWYYSTYHFCVGMMTFEDDLCHESFPRMRDEYFLKEFDGVSDEALQMTWP